MNEPDAEFEGLLEYVRDARGFDYTGYRRPTLMRRFEKRMQDVGSLNWGEYEKYLSEHPEEFNELFNAILINVTGFFRDRETWDLVASEIVPQLIERHDGATPIRIWSAGCASGEEPYTILMVLAEAMGEKAFKSAVKIYATDIDEDALRQAREATYTPKQLESVPVPLRERYFQPVNGTMALRKDLRRSVIFGRNDLHRDPPISRVDVLISRNTLMYFGTDVQERILGNFYFALNRGGYLVVGKAEALQGARRLFTPFNLKRRIFVKDGTAPPGFLIPRLPALEEVPLAEMPELRDAAFEHAPIAQIVVDHDNQIAAINQPARTLFGLKLKDVGRPLEDVDIAHKPLDLRPMIDEVRSKRRIISSKDTFWERAPGEERALDIQVSPLMATADHVIGVSVSFVDVTLHRTLEQHLETARRELETAYEELQSTVEELETTNEELQSTNEELETTNEELQSTNEELETMNEELQSTNEELETMNDELRERTDETMHANAFLSSVLSGIQQAVIVVDQELHVIAWNSLATDLWGLRPEEVEGKHLLNLDIGLRLESLREQIRHVLAGESPEAVALEGHNRRGHPVTYSIGFAPMQGDTDDIVIGAILLVDAERAKHGAP